MGINLSQMWETQAQAATISQGNILALLLGGVVIVLSFWLISILVVALVKNWVIKLAKRIRPDLDSETLIMLLRPIRWFILSAGVYTALLYLPLPPSVDQFINRLYRSLIVLFFAWGIHALLDSRAMFSAEARERYHLDNSLVVFFSKIARFVVIALAVLVVAREWGYDLNGFLAGLGLGGLAIALAAKDALANIVGGIVIIMERPFSIGDLITTPHAEGVVEEISFRSTRLKSPTQALITVPNSMIANASITNHSRLGRKRLAFHLKLSRDTSRDQLQSATEAIRAILMEHPQVLHDNVQVYFEQIGEGSLDISISCFTATGEGADHQAVRADINLKLLELLETMDIQLAS